MKTQFNWLVRVVALENLEAMCDECSGGAYEFGIVKTTPHRVYVRCSGFDGIDRQPPPIAAVYPCYQLPDDPGEVSVVLDPIRYTGDRADEAFRAFDILTDCAMYYNTDWQCWAEDPRTREELIQDHVVVI